MGKPRVLEMHSSQRGLVPTLARLQEELGHALRGCAAGYASLPRRCTQRFSKRWLVRCSSRSVDRSQRGKLVCALFACSSCVSPNPRASFFHPLTTTLMSYTGPSMLAKHGEVDAGTQLSEELYYRHQRRPEPAGPSRTCTSAARASTCASWPGCPSIGTRPGAAGGDGGGEEGLRGCWRSGHGLARGGPSLWWPEPGRDCRSRCAAAIRGIGTVAFVTAG